MAEFDHAREATMVRLLGVDPRYWRCTGHSGLSSTDGCGRIFIQGELIDDRFAWIEQSYVDLPEHMRKYHPDALAVDHA